jgi:hypothetical protein
VASATARHATNVWETTDPDGRRVRLRTRAWLHILDQHEELYDSRDAILRTVNRPDERLPGREVGEEWYYGTGFGIGPTNLVKVVVHYEGEVGFIVTAFPRSVLP